MDFNSKYKSSEIEELLDKVDTLATVATSGSYNDLSNKPTIPSAVTEDTVNGWGFTKNKGTITGVSVNGTSVTTSGNANIPAASTNAYGATKLSSATNSTSEVLAATPKAVKSAYDLANGKVSKVKVNGVEKSPQNGVVDLGTVITAHQTLKTINGESIVGSGDITISGGGGEQIEEPYVDNSSGNKVIMFENTTVNNTSVNTPMMPGVTYVCTEPVDGVILYNIQLPTGNTGKYTLHFAIDAQGGYLDLNPNLSFYYPNGEVNLELEPFGTYELSIVATKLVYNGEPFWLYKAVLTSFKFH